MKGTTRLKVLDYFILALSAGAATFAGIETFSNQDGTPYVIIETPKNTWIYALSEDTVVFAEGAAGVTEIHIQNGTVYFADSPCPGKTCTQTPPISRNGQWIACMPNQVLAHISAQNAAQNDSEVDIIVH